MFGTDTHRNSTQDAHKDIHSEQGGLRGEHPGRSLNPIIKVTGLAWLEFEKPDLQRTEAFANAFGLTTAARSADELQLRGTDAGAPCVLVRRGASSRLSGIAFTAADAADLTRHASGSGHPRLERVCHVFDRRRQGPGQERRVHRASSVSFWTGSCDSRRGDDVHPSRPPQRTRTSPAALHLLHTRTTIPSSPRRICPVMPGRLTSQRHSARIGTDGNRVETKDPRCGELLMTTGPPDVSCS